MIKKKVYKKNKKVVETVIFRRQKYIKKTNYSRFFIGVIIFAIVFVSYYFNILHIATPTSSVTLHDISSILGSNDLAQGKAADEPFPVNLQKTLLKQSKNTISPTPKKITSSDIGSNQIIWHGPRDKKEVALTFDADMTPVMVDWLHSGQVQSYDDTRITNFLMQHQIKATFFLTGLWIESYPDATKQLADNSLFELEDHSYSHPSMVAEGCFGQPEIPASQYPYEIEKTQQLIEQYTHQAPKYFRFPGGCYDQSDLNLVKKEGLVTVHWDDVADDGFNDNEDAIIHNVLSEAQNGSIIVMHIGGIPNVPKTADALPTIIDTLQKQGYSFVTVSELLDPPQVVAKVTPKEYLTSLKSFQTLSP